MHPISVGAVTDRGFSLLPGTRTLFVFYEQFPWFLGDPTEVVARLRAERHATL